MLTRKRGLRPLLLLLVVLPTLAGCGTEVPPTVDPVRAVAVTTLKACRPDPGVRVVGVAEPYREAEVAFEVSGRLTAVLDVGRSVEVKTKRGADGRPVHTGDVIAQIDTTTYRQRLEGAELKRTTAESGLKAQLVDLEQVAPATAARAKAQRDAALSQVTSARATIASAESAKKTTEADLQRQKQLLGDRQISKAEFDRSQNEFETAVANLAKANAGLQSALDNAGAAEATVSEVKASIRLKAETVAQARNQLNELTLVVAQAQTDLDRCTLRAPFSGRITYVYASNGDFMAAGKPVLRLTLIDPIKISATVSPDLERTIQPGNYARVEPRNLGAYQLGETALFGTVFEKGAVADPATRTFRIDVMVRNARRLMAHDVAKSVTRVNFRNLLPAVERNFGEEGPLFVCSDCLVEEGGKQVVYRLKGAKFGKPRPAGMFDSTLPLERIEVDSKPAVEADYMQILNWSFQRAEAVNGSGSVGIGDLLL
ncbi:MAG: HlyD family efflux transporter periplasmic adaptor subunit, partial [bacterium]|nr:HlyD family efflux transporter periplasmic adaptor subunit [bacterium]